MDRLENNNIVKEVQDSFLDYSMSVITARAIPDLRRSEEHTSELQSQR